MGLVGSLLFSRYSRRWPRAFLLVSTSVLACWRCWAQHGGCGR